MNMHPQKPLFALCATLSLALGMTLLSMNTAASAMGPHIPNQLIVKFKSGISQKSQEAVFSKLNVRQIDKLKLINADVVEVPANKPLEAWIKTFKSSSTVLYVEPNYEVQASAVTLPNDPYFSKLWGLNNTGQNGGTVDADIDAPEAWAGYTPTKQIIVAVIDTGVDYTHPDLASNMWINPGEDINKDGKITSADANGKDDDGDGYIDDFRGWDFANNDNNPMDDNKHGTHVAGTIAARTNNGYGVAGVAGQGAVKIMPLKFLKRNGSGSTSDAVKALEYATAKGALISNNSWGGGGYSQALYDAILKNQQAGALFIVAAGNNTSNNDTTPTYPASYNLYNIISVASITNLDKLSYFSNYGANTVHLAAPGSDIYSTLPKSSFGSLSGTSMASPHVAGVAALVWSQYPSLTASEVKAKLLSSVRPVSALSGYVLSGGVVNAQNALAP